MIRFLSTLLLILFVASCSLNEKSTFWTKGKKISREKQKPKEFYSQILDYKKSNENILTETRKRLNRDFSE